MLSGTEGCGRALWWDTVQTNTIVFPTTANGVYIMARRSLFLAKVGPPGVRSGVCVRERENLYVRVCGWIWCWPFARSMSMGVCKSVYSCALIAMITVAYLGVSTNGWLLPKKTLKKPVYLEKKVLCQRDTSKIYDSMVWCLCPLLILLFFFECVWKRKSFKFMQIHVGVSCRKWVISKLRIMKHKLI